MKIFQIPFSNIPQKFSISLNGKDYFLKNVWNGENKIWEMSIFNGETEEPILASLALTTGVNLLSQYAHLGIGGKMYVYTDGDDSAVSTEANLGAESNLYFFIEE